MIKKFHKTEGVILSSIKYRDCDQIVTLFSFSAGMLKLFIRRAFKKQMGGFQSAPFVEAEFLYSERCSELFLCQEISLINAHLALRTSYEILNSAALLNRALLVSQPLSQPAPMIYKLFISYLNALPTFSYPAILVASFRLKIMRHNGTLPFSSECNACGLKLHSAYFDLSGIYCCAHAPQRALKISEKEMISISYLVYARSFETLAQTFFDEKLEQKITFLFEHQFLY